MCLAQILELKILKEVKKGMSHLMEEDFTVYGKADVPDNIAGATVAHKSAKSVKRFL